jgi:hypothetical protein
MSLSPRRSIFALLMFSAVPLLAACPKKEQPATVDAAPPPPPPAEDAQTVLVEMVEDAGPDVADAADAKPKYTGAAVNTNVARLKQCCNQLAAEAKRMGNSPEAGMFTAAAAQCNTIAAQVGPTGTAPELGALRSLLAGRTIPAPCAGF